ncbi:hypothetical protein Hanom_Chr04g00305641 [Helianthus anomalus]
MNYPQGAAIEATANPKKEAIFDSKLKIGSCYKVSEYIAIKSRDYMKVVPHGVTLRLGATAVFEPLHDDSIPTYYYNFATYDMLASQKANPKPLTGNNNTFVFCKHQSKTRHLEFVMKKKLKI